MSRQQIVILEGADGTGKTTLAKALEEKHGYAYIHCTYSSQLVGHMTGYFIGVLSAAIHISKTRPVVIDRWRMSELVYGEVFRAGPENPYATESLFDMADAAGAFYAFCHPSHENREKYLDSFDKLKKEREEMYDKMAGVYDCYERNISTFLYRKPREWMRYDRFATTVEDAVGEITIGF